MKMTGRGLSVALVAAVAFGAADARADIQRTLRLTVMPHTTISAYVDGAQSAQHKVNASSQQLTTNLLVVSSSPNPLVQLKAKANILYELVDRPKSLGDFGSPDGDGVSTCTRTLTGNDEVTGPKARITQDGLKLELILLGPAYALSGITYGSIGAAALGGLHLIGMGISRAVVASRDKKGTRLPEEVTVEAAVGDYVPSEKAAHYAGVLTDGDGSVVGEATVKTSAPGRWSGLMNISAKVRMDGRTYSFRRLEVQSKVEGPLQVTMKGLGKAGKVECVLLFGDGRFAGTCGGYALAGDCVKRKKEGGLTQKVLRTMPVSVKGLEELGAPENKLTYSATTGKVAGRLVWKVRNEKGKERTLRGKAEGAVVGGVVCGKVSVKGRGEFNFIAGDEL